jgi:hypothetical protein
MQMDRTSKIDGALSALLECKEPMMRAIPCCLEKRSDDSGDDDDQSDQQSDFNASVAT